MTPLAIEAPPASGSPVSAAHAPSFTPGTRDEAVATLRLVLVSRILIWVVGCTAVALLGTSAANIHAFDPHGISTSLGRVGNVLAAPAVRWDSIWYLQIADHGYGGLHDTAFFPLYPLLIRAGTVVTRSSVVAAVLISLVAFALGLELVRRLTELELGPRAARVSVLLIAFGPMALYDSAVYTEGLFLALSAGTFLAARRGRWGLAGALGGMAAMSRVAGGLLVVPLVILFLYGPRGDAPSVPAVRRWRPRYGVTPAILWLTLIPAGAMLFSGYLALRGYGLGATMHAESLYWGRRVVGPLTGVWDGARAAWLQIRLELQGISPPLRQADAVAQLATLVLVVTALVGTFRRLPLAYGAYVVVSLLQTLSAPAGVDPLSDFDRYASAWFPLLMWAAAWAVDHRAERKLVVGSALLLAACTVQFATWQWVGTPRL